MKSRREFFKSVAVAGALGSIGLPAIAETNAPVKSQDEDDRRYWISILEKLAAPVLTNLSKEELKKRMPVEAANPSDRARYTHLEAFGRLLAGISPWLELRGLDGNEAKLQSKWIDLTHKSLDAATNPDSADFLNFKAGGQALVDTAFLAQGILRAPQTCWETLDSRLQRQIVEALKSSRAIGTPDGSNWVMFTAMVEAALLHFGEPTIEERLEACVRKMLSWYKGDGAYGDGKFFHFDYYNSFVIHPMLVDVLRNLFKKDERFETAYRTALNRARRFAEVQERLVAPDGTFPSLGRSTTYRCGAFQSLAQIALQEKLPESIRPAQVRAALTAVIRRTLEAPETFDRNGWLQLGFCGHQPSLAESYISTGSLYLCSAALLPLGLPPENLFWQSPAVPWTSQRLWSGELLAADHALSEESIPGIPTLRRSGS
ncbi:MAG TPA: DUF2264 domain-containing protein [Candidatus Paceibacterota bacterium]|nr:DUF2264 domain-containing protein [Candidatus Paceibacterota bacterium]